MYVEGPTMTVICEGSRPAGEYCSSYTGECVAFLHALEWIEGNELATGETGTILISSDSMSLAQSLRINNWKDKDPWLKLIKHTLCRLESKIIMLWIPSHCDIPGNERADELAKLGSNMNQEAIPVTHSIIKAKIKNRKWEVTHDRARGMYGDRRSPRMDVEKLWSRKVRTLFSRLRTGHAKELKQYRHKIEVEEDGMCDHGCGEEETIEHALCHCEMLEEERVKTWNGEVTIDMMVSEPEVCRTILMKRFGDLYMKKKGKKSNTKT